MEAGFVRTILECSTNVEGFSELKRDHNLFLKETHKQVGCVLGESITELCGHWPLRSKGA